MMEPKIDAYDDYASEYARLVAEREEAGIEHEPIMPQFLEMLGDVSGLTVLDAGCGEGYLSRILAHRGASVTGIDISPRLIEIAYAKHPEGTITYQVANLSQPLPAYKQHFDLVVSHLVLNDVYDYQGFLDDHIDIDITVRGCLSARKRSKVKCCQVSFFLLKALDAAVRGEKTFRDSRRYFWHTCLLLMHALAPTHEEHPSSHIPSRNQSSHC